MYVGINFAQFIRLQANGTTEMVEKEEEKNKNQRNILGFRSECYNGYGFILCVSTLLFHAYSIQMYTARKLQQPNMLAYVWKARRGN